MTHYVVVAAVRIQSWLTRTPRLLLMRGASRALHEFTEATAVNDVLRGARLLGDQTRVADDAGDVDGVIVVQTTPEAAHDVRRALHEHVRRTLPGLEWTLWDGHAATVLDALTASKDENELILAELMTVPFARRCQGCGAETASRRDKVGVDQLWLGPDCRSRRDSGRTDWRPGHAYRDGLNIPGDNPPTTTEGLARAQGRRDESADRYGGKRNHIAVVCADGNSIGELFRGITKEQRSHAVEALDRATRDALSAAARDITGANVVVEPHFVGGDDVLVSVPAPLAWSFVIHLARRFEQHLAEYFAGKPGAGEPAAASLGIGLCFSHSAYPFAHAREVAFAAMKEAKKGVQGAQGAVGWADLTAEDGVVPGRYRTSVRLEALRRGVVEGGDLVVPLTNSARAEVAAEIDEGGGRFDTPARAVGRLVTAAARNNNDRLRNWLMSTPPDRAVADLRAGISLARWWPVSAAVTASAESVHP